MKEVLWTNHSEFFHKRWARNVGLLRYTHCTCVKFQNPMRIMHCVSCEINRFHSTRYAHKSTQKLTRFFRPQATQEQAGKNQLILGLVAVVSVPVAVILGHAQIAALGANAALYHAHRLMNHVVSLMVTLGLHSPLRVAYPGLWALELAAAAIMTLPAACLAVSAAKSLVQQCAERPHLGLTSPFMYPSSLRPSENFPWIGDDSKMFISGCSLIFSLAYLISIVVPAWHSETSCQRERRSDYLAEGEEQQRRDPRYKTTLALIRLAVLLVWSALTLPLLSHRQLFPQSVPFTLLFTWILHFCGLKLFQGSSLKI